MQDGRSAWAPNFRHYKTPANPLRAGRPAPAVELLKDCNNRNRARLLAVLQRLTRPTTQTKHIQQTILRRFASYSGAVWRGWISITATPRATRAIVKLNFWQSS